MQIAMRQHLTYYLTGIILMYESMRKCYLKPAQQSIYAQT